MYKEIKSKIKVKNKNIFYKSILYRMSNLFILDTTSRQDEMIFSRLNEADRKIAKEMIVEYAMGHLFSSLVIKYRDDYVKLRAEINKALEEREQFIRNLGTKFGLTI